MALQPPRLPSPAAETGSPACPAPSNIAVADPGAAATPAFSLPPVDHGRDAYLVLAACSLAQAPIWGYSISFGVFQEYYSTHSLRTASPAAVTSVGTTQTGVMYLAVPVVVAVLARFPRTRPWCGPLGLVLAVAGLAGSSARDSSVPVLISTQGALYALGCALLFGPASLCLDEWFVARKGFALGVMWAAKGAVGAGMPLLMSVLLTHFGLATTLRAWTVATVLLALPGLVMLRKPRLPAGAIDDAHAPLPAVAPSPDVAEAAAADAAVSPSAAPRRPLAFLRRPFFWLLMVGNTVQALGYQIPNTYIASYSDALLGDGSAASTSPHTAPLGAFTGAFLLALSAGGATPGAIVIGILSDRLSATTVVLISSLGSTASIFGLWYVSDTWSASPAVSSSSSFALLVAFVLIYGFFAGGFSSTWSAVQHAMRHRDPATDTSLVFGLLMGGRGLGFVLSGPISGALLAGSRSTTTAAATAASTTTITQAATAASPSAVFSSVVTTTVAAITSSFSAAAAAASTSPSTDAVPLASYKPLIICTGTTATLGACGALWSLGTPCRRLGRRMLVLGERLQKRMA